MSTDRVLTAERLIALLQVLPAGSLVKPNTVGNLMVLTADGQYIGFVEFGGKGAVELDTAQK